MKIVEIRKLNGDAKHRYVVLEGGERVFCPVSVLAENALEEGSDVELASFKRQIEEGEKRLAEEIAVRKLTFSSRSEKEIRRSLKEKRIPYDAIDETVEKLERYHYIDDERFVKNYLSVNGKKYGRKKIEYVLTVEKGVDKEVVREIVFESLDDETEHEKAMTLADKYLTPRVVLGKSPKQKLYAYLLQRGFENSIVSRAVEDAFTALKESEEGEED